MAPAYTAKYLQKTECFCFTPQDFAPARAARVHGALHRGPGPAAAGGPHDAGIFDVHAARAARSRRVELIPGGRPSQRPSNAADSERNDRAHGTRTRRARHRQVLHPARQQVAGGRRRHACSPPCSARVGRAQRLRAFGTLDRLPRPRRRGLHVLRLVRHGDRREPARPVQRRRRPLVPHGDDAGSSSPR